MEERSCVSLSTCFLTVRYLVQLSPCVDGQSSNISIRVLSTGVYQVEAELKALTQ